ncbi:hypothetical protein SAMN04487886_11824 [Clostridium sp. DSM 8431]|uniref:insulinase family protein n=1 Tax=Clostridium sp. DSM 8431 TaxID=1761781 RepID=UPI0008E55DC9|nr:insulinase family protein [Clostridium sp. DSM 8431]SFU81304.1 hypothetical protein SAMN04487886_11824 [Clostridium sp. DSM 8431]
MSFNFNKLKRTSLNEYFYDIDNDVDVIKYIIPCGYSSQDIPSGYAHLLEHMYINSNYKYLKELEKQGVRFNGATYDKFMVIDLIDSTGKNILRNSNFIKENKIMKNEFLEKQLQLEKKTIAQELGILRKTLGTEKADYMLGSPEEVKGFSINKLNEVYGKVQDKYVRVIFGNSQNNESLSEFRSKNEMSWLKALAIKSIKHDKDSFFIYLKDSYNARILFYSLYIFFDKDLQLGSPDYRVEAKDIIITVPVNYSKFESVISHYKENSINRYILRNSLSFKSLSSEVENIINIFNEYFDDYSIENSEFYFENWESVIRECRDE